MIFFKIPTTNLFIKKQLGRRLGRKQLGRLGGILLLIFKLIFIFCAVIEANEVEENETQNEKSKHQNNNILLPFSLYEKMLLAKALDEHRAVEIDEEKKNNKLIKNNNKILPQFPKEEEENNLNKTIIIYLPPPPSTTQKYPQIIEKSPRKGEKFDDKRVEEQFRRRRPNPQLMLFKSHSDEQFVWKNKMKEKKVKSMVTSMSSDEQYSNRPITLFLPAPVKNYKNQKQNEYSRRENWRPVQAIRIINSPKTSNDLSNKIALTKQMISFAEEPPLPPIIANNNQEMKIKALGPSILPSEATNNVNEIASKLFGQFFSTGDNNKAISAPSPPRMAAAPLSGSPFDLFSGGGGLAAAGGQSATPNPLLQMLSQGSTLEQITTLAKNLLQMSNGNKEILSTLMNAITGGGGQTSKLTSSALATASLQKQPPQQQNNAISTFLAGNKSTLPSAVIIEDEELFGINSSYNNNNNKFLEREVIKETSSVNETLASLNGFSLEQRKLLAAAVLNGELDPEQAVKLLTSENGTIANETISELNKTSIDNSLFDYEDQLHQTFYGQLEKKPKENRHLINSESRLIEWIQQNRPRHSSENLNENLNKNVTTTITPTNYDWTNSAEKLPYWGRYFGSFVEQTDNSPYNIAGAVWAVDEQRLLITKFTFIPSQFENITFWAGPTRPTSNAALDLFPSENGFIVEAIPLELNLFNKKPIQIEAKIFNNNKDQINKTETIFKNENGSEKVGKKNEQINLLAEREEEEDEEKIIIATNTTTNTTKRDRRNLYNEIFGNKNEENDNINNVVDNFDNNFVSQQDDKIEEIKINENKTEEYKLFVNETNILPVSVKVNNKRLLLQFDKKEKDIENDKKTMTIKETNKQQKIKNLILFQQQTLLLTLPPEHFTKNIDWLAVWDHSENNKNKEALAVVLMPKGVAHQIPSIVQIRAFPSPVIGINGVKLLQSGSIKILDTKTIEVTEFTFKSEQLPAWFMVGKEIMPNAKGHIVPIFDRINKNFNCDSLREFNNETVTLRLPDPFDIKDVFWFAIFSIPRGIPLSHIYLPYNDMQIPPDLQSLQTPQCIWKRILPN